MARINVEDKIYRDERFHKLSAQEGKYRALGLCVAAWDLAHKWHLKHPEGLIPFAEWDDQPELELIIRCGLAERRENGIYVKGSIQECHYLKDRQSAGRKGGLKSQENFSSKTKQIEQNQPSSSSSSSKGNNKKHMSAPNGADDTSKQYDLEKIYQEYPKRYGEMKKAEGLSKLKKIIKSQQDYDLAVLAVKNYSQYVAATNRLGTDYVKMFSSFWDRQGDWKEWAVKQNHQSDPLVVKTVLIDLS